MKRVLQIAILFIVTSLIITCGDDSTGPEPPPEPTTGAVELTTSTSGSDTDADGYTVSAGGTSESVASSGSVIVANLPEGDVDAKLTGLAGNCAVGGDNPQTVSITAGDTTSSSFDVKCQPVADGQIAFGSYRDGDGEVFLMNTDGSSPSKLTDNTYTDDQPVISHDGTKIAFVSNRSGTNGLYVMDADGSNVQQVTSASARVSMLVYMSWSPDDSTLAFLDFRSGNLEIYTIGADGSGKQRLTNNSAFDGYPHWSPDGSKIVYSSDTDGDGEIYTMNPDGTGRVQITNNTTTPGGSTIEDTQPRWSPDGSRIAFTSNRDGNPEIYTMNADGTGVTRVTNNSALDGGPTWSPDGSELAFDTDRDGNYEVYKVNADGSGSPINLTANSAGDLYPHWSPVQ